MIAGLLALGFVGGLSLAGLTLAAGGTILQALLVYSLGGSLSVVLAAAARTAFAGPPRTRSAPAPVGATSRDCWSPEI